MKIDLFGQTIGEVLENRGEGVPHFSDRLKVNSGTAEPRVPAVEPRGTVVPLITSRRSGRSATRSADRTQALISDAHRLQADLGRIDQSIYEIQRSYDDLKAAFHAASDALEWAWHSRDHSAEARAARRPLYDARMAAGMAWHPVRTAYQNLHGWRRRVVNELACINAEIER